MIIDTMLTFLVIAHSLFVGIFLYSKMTDYSYPTYPSSLAYKTTYWETKSGRQCYKFQKVPIFSIMYSS